MEFENLWCLTIYSSINVTVPVLLEKEPLVAKRNI